MVAMNSMPQQDVAKGKGQMEFFRASPTAFSNEVAKNPGPSIPAGECAISSFVRLFSIRSISKCFKTKQQSVFPLQSAFAQDVVETHQENGHKAEHFQEAEHAQSF